MRSQQPESAGIGVRSRATRTPRRLASTRLTRTLLTLGAPALLVVACAMPGEQARGSARSGASSAGLEHELDRLEREGDSQAVIDFVDASAARARSDTSRARLQLAKARALLDLKREFEALACFKRAWQELAPSTTGVANDILMEWGDAEVGLREFDDAIRHYEQALGARDLGRERTRRLHASLVVACTAAGRTKAAEEHRAALDLQGIELVVSLEQRLLGRPPVQQQAAAPAAAAPVSLAPGKIPSDPRQLLPDIHRRAEWNASPITADHVPMTRITSLTVHHTAFAPPPPQGASTQVKRIQQEHTGVKGWADIGYHFLIDPSGGIWEGRQLVYQGAHAGGAANIGNIGICLMGDFERNPVPAAQLRGLDRLLARLRDQFDLDADDVRTHREWKATACPGGYLQSAVMAYRSGSRATVARQ